MITNYCIIRKRPHYEGACLAGKNAQFAPCADFRLIALTCINAFPIVLVNITVPDFQKRLMLDVANNVTPTPILAA